MLVLGVAVLVVERRRAERVRRLVAAVYLGQAALVNLTKLLVDRARPVLDRLAGFASSSFPSGHSATQRRHVRGLRPAPRPPPRSVGTPRCSVPSPSACAVAVASSRVLLGVHWITDTVAGLAIGWAWFAVCSIAFGGRLVRFGQPADDVVGGSPAPSDDDGAGDRPPGTAP